MSTASFPGHFLAQLQNQCICQGRSTKARFPGAIIFRKILRLKSQACQVRGALEFLREEVIIQREFTDRLTIHQCVTTGFFPIFIERSLIKEYSTRLFLMVHYFLSPLWFAKINRDSASICNGL